MVVPGPPAESQVPTKLVTLSVDLARRFVFCRVSQYGLTNHLCDAHGVLLTGERGITQRSQVPVLSIQVCRDRGVLVRMGGKQ